jgi:hypothetical protein
MQHVAMKSKRTYKSNTVRSLNLVLVGTTVQITQRTTALTLVAAAATASAVMANTSSSTRGSIASQARAATLSY